MPYNKISDVQVGIEGIGAYHAKDKFWTWRKVVILIAILLGLLAAFLITFFLLRHKKKQTQKKIEEEEKKKLKDITIESKGHKLTTDVELGTVQMNSKDGYNVSKYSDFVSTDGLTVSDKVKQAVEIENSPNIAVSSIIGSNGQQLASNCKGFVVDDGKITTISQSGARLGFAVEQGMQVKLTDGRVINYSDLKTMDNVYTDSKGIAILKKDKTTANATFTKDNVSVSCNDENGTNYFSFSRSDISDPIEIIDEKTKNVIDKPFNDIVQNIKANTPSLNNKEDDPIPGKFVDLWLEKGKSESVKEAWKEMVETEEVKYKDIKNTDALNNLNNANIVLSV